MDRKYKHLCAKALFIHVSEEFLVWDYFWINNAEMHSSFAHVCVCVYVHVCACACVCAHACVCVHVLICVCLMTWIRLAHMLYFFTVAHKTGKDHDRCLRRPWKHCQHWRQNNHRSPLCWWHQRLSRREELAKLVDRLNIACTVYSAEITAEKTKLMTTPAASTRKSKGQNLWTVTSFKYLGSVVSDKGSEPEILSRIA